MSVWDPCAASPESCGGQQAGGRRFILNADDDPEAEVDAGKSARKARRENNQQFRQGAREHRRDLLAGRPGALGWLGRLLGGDPSGQRRSWETTDGVVTSEHIDEYSVVVRRGVFERWRDRWQAGGGLRGWWDRLFPDGRSGGGWFGAA